MKRTTRSQLIRWLRPPPHPYETRGASTQRRAEPSMTSRPDLPSMAVEPTGFGRHGYRGVVDSEERRVIGVLADTSWNNSSHES